MAGLGILFLTTGFSLNVVGNCSMTKKSQIFHKRKIEKRDSRLKDTRNLILSKSYSTLMNNQKWYDVFELLEEYNLEFELKTLLSTEIKKADQILELENSSILIDNSGDFIEFLEIEQISLNNTADFIDRLEKLNIEFVEHDHIIQIRGYR